MRDIIHDCLRSRRSIRRFTDREVSDECLHRIIECVMSAPSAHNAQPTRLVVIRRGRVRESLIQNMSMIYKRDLIADGVDEETAGARVELSRQLLTDAPVLILICLTMRDMWRYPDATRQECEHTMAVQSAAAATQNLLLAAHGEGLGACWMCAPLFCPDTVKKICGLPDDYEPQAFVILGYPAERPGQKTLRTMDEVVRWIN